MDVLDKRVEPRIVQHVANIWRLFEITVTLERTHHDTFITFSLLIRVTLCQTCSCKSLVNTMRKRMDFFAPRKERVSRKLTNMLFCPSHIHKPTALLASTSVNF